LDCFSIGLDYKNQKSIKCYLLVVVFSDINLFPLVVFWEAGSCIGHYDARLWDFQKRIHYISPDLIFWVSFNHIFFISFQIHSFFFVSTSWTHNWVLVIISWWYYINQQIFEVRNHLKRFSFKCPFRRFGFWHNTIFHLFTGLKPCNGIRHFLLLSLIDFFVVILLSLVNDRHLYCTWTFVFLFWTEEVVM